MKIYRYNYPFTFSIVIILLLAMFYINSNAATDSTTIGPGYSLLSWYKLKDKSTKSAQVSSWDIALSTALDASIRINDASTVKLWYVVGSDATSFDEPGALDTNGLSSDLEGKKFKQYFNSPLTWAIGAFNMGKNGFAEGGDFGWGKYNQAIHQLTGKVLFVIALANGEYKKIFIAKWANWIYTIKIANLDGSDSKTLEINSKNYSNKLFIYYSFVTNELLDIEPNSDDWDIVFGKYTDVARMGNIVYDNYPVTGGRINPKVKVASVTGVKSDEAKQPYLYMFSNRINSIGYHWKSFNQNTNQWVVPDTITYFVISEDDGYLYKLWFSGFGGSSTGKIYFNTEKILMSVNDIYDSNIYFAIHPNVISKGEALNIILTDEILINKNSIDIYSIAGQKVFSKNFEANNTVNVFRIENLNLHSGFYFVRINLDGKILQQKFVIN